MQGDLQFDGFSNPLGSHPADPPFLPFCRSISSCQWDGGFPPNPRSNILVTSRCNKICRWFSSGVFAPIGSEPQDLLNLQCPADQSAHHSCGTRPAYRCPTTLQWVPDHPLGRADRCHRNQTWGGQFRGGLKAGAMNGKKLGKMDPNGSKSQPARCRLSIPAQAAGLVSWCSMVFSFPEASNWSALPKFRFPTNPMSIQKLIGHIFLIGRQFNYKFETGVRTQITNNYRYQNKKTLRNPRTSVRHSNENCWLRTWPQLLKVSLKVSKQLLLDFPGNCEYAYYLCLHMLKRFKKLKTSGQNITIITYIYIYTHIIMIIIINSSK